MAILSFYFFRQYRPGKSLLKYYRTKKRLFSLEKQEVQKVEKLTFFHRGNPWFWFKNGHFSNLLFLGNIGQENVFYQILEQKNTFLAYKKKKLKMSENWHFFKGVNPWFWSKSVHFSNFFFLGNIGQENVFYDILERKNAFLGYKKKKFKKSKNWHFSKGVNQWLWSKNGHFSKFFF